MSALFKTAERIVAGSCGPDLKVQFYGNGPSGFYKYKYPKPVQERTNRIGAKVIGSMLIFLCNALKLALFFRYFFI